MSQPSDANPLPDSEARHSGAGFVHSSDNLMPRDHRHFVNLEIALNNLKIGAADGADIHFHPDLARPSPRRVDFCQSQRRLVHGHLFGKDHCLHPLKISGKSMPAVWEYPCPLGRRSSVSRPARLGILDEREFAQHLLQPDDLTRNKLCNSQSDDIGDGTHIGNESSRFIARQAVRLRTKTEDDLGAIQDIDIEMDGNTRAPRRLEPIEKRPAGQVKIVRTKRSDPPTGYVGEIVFGPGMQADKSHSSWIKGGRQKAKYIWISMTSEDCNRHSMVSGVFTSGSADVGVRIDPQHRKIIAITFGQPGERRHAHRALSAKGEDSLRVVAAYHLQCSGQLRNYCLLCFNPVLFAETKIARVDRNESGRSAVRWQHG